MYRFAIVGILFAGACFTRRVETMSHPISIDLRLTDTCGDAAILEQHVGAGRYELVPVTAATAHLELPGMDGGYTEGVGGKSNVSDPDEYEVVRLRLGARVLVELSPKELRALPRDPGGRAIVPVQCA